MSSFIVARAAEKRLDDIYAYTTARWSEAQADEYTRRLFSAFQAIADRRLPGRRVPDRLALNGYYGRVGAHLVYWRVLADGRVEIVTVLHAAMQQPERLAEDLD